MNISGKYYKLWYCGLFLNSLCQVWNIHITPSHLKMVFATPLKLIVPVAVRVPRKRVTGLYIFSSRDICNCVGVLLAIRRKQQNVRSRARRPWQSFLKCDHQRPRHFQVLVNWKIRHTKCEHSSDICRQSRLVKVVLFLSENNHYIFVRDDYQY